MPELLIDLLAGTGVIVLSLIWYFYVYPSMKKEYERNGWTWKRYYVMYAEMITDGHIGISVKIYF